MRSCRVISFSVSVFFFRSSSSPFGFFNVHRRTLDTGDWFDVWLVRWVVLMMTTSAETKLGCVRGQIIRINEILKRTGRVEPNATAESKRGDLTKFFFLLLFRGRVLYKLGKFEKHIKVVTWSVWFGLTFFFLEIKGGDNCQPEDWTVVF